MKIRFPLFARLLLWFLVNLLVLLVALWITLRFEFGSQYRGFLPDSSRRQTQAMAEVLIGDLAKTPGERWNDVFLRLSGAYHMQFGLFGPTGNQIAGQTFDIPAEARSMILMTGHGGAPRPEGGEGGPPPGEGGAPDGTHPPGGLQPGPPPPRGSGPQLLPEFPQRVIRTSSPETVWLLIHLPMDQLRMAGIGPAMLVGWTRQPDLCPLLFNPNPWLGFALAMTIFTILFWLILTRSLTNTIARMTLATEAIAEGRFDLQAPDQRADELGRLGLAINRMAGRLKGFISGQRRFLGDAAHELCSPLSRMEVALAILEERSDEASAARVRDVREEVTHMRKLADELLSFSKASLGENHIKLEPISVAEAVEKAVHQERSGADQVMVLVPENLRVVAHPELLVRALGNLIRNALRYAGADGPVIVSSWEEEEQVFVAVSDEGPGVPAGEIERLFDPFYRLDESRDSQTGGVGLGLAIVKTCVEACRGTVTAFNRTPRGLQVQLRFPGNAAV